VGKVCDWTGATTFSQAWERTMGPQTSSLFATIISVKTALSCLAYSMILGESFQSLAISAGFLDVTRTEALLAVTCTALVPLCLMKDLSSLAPFSFAGILGFAFTGAAMTLRAHDGSYHLAPIDTIESGRYLIDIPDPYKPSFGETGPEIQGLVLACTLATAFVSHYNAPRFHNELEQKEHFDTVTYTSFGISAALMAIIAVAGFTTFGIASAPVILNNYSPYDPLIGAGRTAIAASLVATFPFPFFGLRDSVWDAMNVPVAQRNSEEGSANNILLTVTLLAVITAAATSVSDLSLLLSVGGGTIATAVYSVFPTIMFRAAVTNRQKQLQQTTKKNDTIDFNQNYLLNTNLATCLMSVCVMTGAAGVGLAIQNHIMH
jgi:amino acid permease